jgi:pilus assembly protein Flp/PilA
MKKKINRQLVAAAVELSGFRTRFRRRRGAVSVEYILLVTVIGIGVLVGLASVRNALINELEDLATAIMAIT